VPTIFEEAMKQNKVDQPIFAFYLGDNEPGELTFGGYDSSKFEGDLKYVKLEAATYWEIAMDDFQISGSTVITTKRAIVDSGTSLLAIPAADIKTIAKLIGAKTVAPIAPFNKEYTIDCDTAGPDMDIILGGNTYTLTKEDYVLNNGGSCLLGMTGMDIPAPAGPLVILGDVFMRAHYVKFDVDGEQIGLAKIVKNAVVEV